MLRIADEMLAPAVIEVRHENFDAAVATSVEAELEARLQAGSVVLDLVAVRFADSSGMAVLVRLHARYAKALHLMNVGPQLARCLTRVPAGRLPAVIDAAVGREADAAPDSLIVTAATIRNRAAS